MFVSGGGSGIGASIVEHFAAQGSKVGFVDINEPASKEVAKKTGATFLKCDIKDVKAYQAALGEIAKTRLAAGATLAGTVSFSFSNF